MAANNVMHVEPEEIESSVNQIHGSVTTVVDEVKKLYDLLQRLLDQTGGKFPLITQSATMLNKEQVALNSAFENVETLKYETSKYVEEVVDAGGDGLFGEAGME